MTVRDNGKLRRKLRRIDFFFFYKIFIFWLSPSLFKLCSFAKSDEFIVFLEFRTELETPSADVLSES